jgi:hypothetical protein
MPARTSRPLTVQNGEGGNAPRKDELVMVQGFLNAAVSNLGAEVRGQIERLEDRIREDLREGRADHKVEHGELRADIIDWRAKHEAACLERMAPYANVDKVFAVLTWIGCHRKQAAGAISFCLATLVAIAALAGGYFKAP